MLRKAISVILSLTFLFVSCKKEQDAEDEANSINWEIISPSAQSNFEIPALIPLKGIVTAENTIDLITIQLNNNNGKVGEAVILSENTSVVELDTFLRITDETIASGTYYLSFNARTSKKTEEHFISIIIIETPLILESTFIVSESGIMYSLNNLGELEEVYRSDADIHIAHVYPNKKFAFLTDTTNKEICGLNLATFSNSWTKSSSDFSSPPILSGIHFSKGEYFFPDESGRINGFNDDNQAIFTSQAKSGFTAERILRMEDRVVSSQKELFSSTYLLRTSFFPSGSLLNENSNAGKVDFMFSSDNDEIITIRNDGNQAEIKRFNTSTNAFVFGDISFNDPIKQAIQLNTDELAVISDQNLYKLNLKTYSKTNLGVIHSSNSRLAYEKVGESIWEYNGNSIYRFATNRQNQSPAELLLTKKIEQLLFLYNR